MNWAQTERSVKVYIHLQQKRRLLDSESELGKRIEVTLIIRERGYLYPKFMSYHLCK